MVTPSKEEQRAFIKFCVNLGKTPTETKQLLEQANNGRTVSRPLVFRWHKEFRDGRKSTKDSPDLAPMDFSVFPAIKSELRGIRFEDLVELRSRVMSIIATFKSDWYRNVFAKWVTRHERCVRCEGRYFEKE